MTAFNCTQCGKYIGWGPEYIGTDKDGTKHVCSEEDKKQHAVKVAKANELRSKYFEDLGKL